MTANEGIIFQKKTGGDTYQIAMTDRVRQCGWIDGQTKQKQNKTDNSCVRRFGPNTEEIGGNTSTLHSTSQTKKIETHS